MQIPQGKSGPLEKPRLQPRDEGRCLRAPPAELDELLNAVFEKFLGSRSLLGTPETCLEMSRQLAAAGVDEVACLLDFGPAEEAILRMLPQIAHLRERCAAAVV